MRRPEFLTSPGSWVRSGSRASDPVRDACAVEVPRRHGGADLIRAIACVAACALIGALLAQGF